MTEPYFQNEVVTLYHGDCRDVLPTLAANSVDLIVTDPPYGQDYKSNRGGDHERIAGDDGTLDVPAVMAAACRLLTRGRHAYVFGPETLVGPPLTATAELVWDKEVVGMGNLSLPWGKSHEPITFAVYEPSQANRAKGYGNLSARVRKGSVVRAMRTNGAGTKNHPTEKPVSVLRQLIESSSVIGETVLDPLVGSGSTLVAAMIEGRHSIGIELDERYCETAVKRIEAAALALKDVA